MESEQQIKTQKRIYDPEQRRLCNVRFRATHKCLAAWFTNKEDETITRYVQIDNPIKPNRTTFFRNAVENYIKMLEANKPIDLSVIE